MNDRKLLSIKILREQQRLWNACDRGILIYVNTMAHRVLFGEEIENAGGLVEKHGSFRAYRVDTMEPAVYGDRLRLLIDRCFQNGGGFTVQENGCIVTEVVDPIKGLVKMKITMDDSHPAVHDNRPLIWVNTVHEF
jgi:hypothetical protein